MLMETSIRWNICSDAVSGWYRSSLGRVLFMASDTWKCLRVIYCFFFSHVRLSLTSPLMAS